MVFELLAKRHARSEFDCGVESVNRYLREQARQQVDKRLAVTCVLVSESGDAQIIGFHTLVMSTLSCAVIPIKGLPQHHSAPVVLLAQLGVDKHFHGEGHGKRLLYHALSQALIASRHAGCLAVALDAIDDSARAFYASRGFRPLLDGPMHLWLPMSEVSDMFSEEQIADPGA